MGFLLPSPAGDGDGLLCAGGGCGGGVVVSTYGAATWVCSPGSGVGWLRLSLHWFRVAAA